jgi:putative SOS response-associated peptidase YedK
MCYTVKIDLTREELEKRFRANFRQTDIFTPGDHINAFTLPRIPVICSGSPGEIVLFGWGLIPYWIKSQEDAQDIRMKTFNAKAETLAEKPSFRNSLQKKRCLVLVNGFYEWQTREKIKIPYRITLKNNRAFALAGLYDNWTNRETGEVINTCTIVTTRANPLMEEIHNSKKRMPVILSSDAEQKWLDLAADPVKEGFFEPFPDEMMQTEKLK